MVIAIVIVTVIVFVGVDLLLRLALRRIDAHRRRRERQAALDLGLKLVQAEATSLKAVEVPAPKARILAVDDEPVVLDSFRKILVLDGFSVSTVESGEQALSLVQQHDYDFVFTDLKMPGLSGLDVTKAVKHLRPDIDVIMITGFATIQSAVDAMKYGALDYVEKPFTEDELVAFANRCLIRRKERLEQREAPRVHLVTATAPGSASPRVFNVPAGAFISPSHAWARIELTGEVRAGLDDFARKTIGAIDGIELPRIGQRVRTGEPLFTVRQGTRSMAFPAPIAGRVSAANADLPQHLEFLAANPYDVGWICRISPDDLARDLQSLRIGAGAVAWYEEEIARLREIERGLPAGSPPEALWQAFAQSLERGLAEVRR